MTQEEIFDQAYEKYKEDFPDMLNGSGGLPDTKGLGTSDVDICLFHQNHASLASYFPADTKIETNSKGTVYTLKGYPREVNIYCSSGEWWQNAYLHRKTELALNEHYPDLSSRARTFKKELGVSTEEAWAKVLGLDGDHFQALLDTEKILNIARDINGRERD